MNSGKVFEQAIKNSIESVPDNEKNMSRNDISNKKVNMLTAIKKVGKNKWGHSMWLCLCDCGETKEVASNVFNRGHAFSCGCTKHARLSQSKIKHGLQKHPLYNIYKAMIYRCYNESNKRYADYGGRCIKVCDEWLNDLSEFIKWAEQNGYKQGLQIDRINNDDDYRPDNCQWITDMKNKEVGKQRKKKNNTSGYVGISFNSDRSKWVSKLDYQRKIYHLGYFTDINKAVEARINKEIELLGEQKTNFNYNGTTYEK